MHFLRSSISIPELAWELDLQGSLLRDESLFLPLATLVAALLSELEVNFTRVHYSLWLIRLLDSRAQIPHIGGALVQVPEAVHIKWRVLTSHLQLTLQALLLCQLHEVNCLSLSSLFKVLLETICRGYLHRLWFIPCENPLLVG